MLTFLKKLRLVFVPYLLLAIGFLICYSAIQWLLLHFQFDLIKEDVFRFWLPIIVACLLVLLWLRPRLKLLRLQTSNGSLPSLYQFVAALAIVVPVIIAQEYLVVATGRLTSLQDIAQLKSKEPSKYYTLERFYIDKNNIGVQSSFTSSGKHNENLNMDLFTVLPLHSDASDTAASTCYAWLGIKYSKQISNRLEDDEKEKEYKTFVDESQNDFENRNVHQFTYLSKVGNSEDGDGYREAIKRHANYQSANAPVFVGVQEPFTARTGDKLQWVFITFVIGAIIMMVMMTIPGLNTAKAQNIKRIHKISNKELREYLEMLIPKEGYFITPIIINLNLLVFIAMVLTGLGVVSFKGTDLLNWGANLRPVTRNWQYWRLLTSTFLHGGLMHLVANMFGLYMAGVLLEPLLGRLRFALLYLTTGILASITSMVWYEATISVGASGAIFGLYGMILALLATKTFPDGMNKFLLIFTLIFIGVNLLMGLAGGVDNAAHLGGLLSGFILGFVLNPSLTGISDTEDT